jgi:hypothetical protein
VPSGNKRVFYGCLGIGPCGSGPMSGVISAKYSLSREISTVFGPGSSTPAATYGNLPNIEISYTSYLTSYTSILSEAGLNSCTGFDMMVGSDASTSNPVLNRTIRGSFMLLSSVTYNLSVDGPFTVERTYIGYSKPSGGPGGSVPLSTATTLRRQNFSGGLPSYLSNMAPQSISVSCKINREYIGEFATRKPYASYIRFPIETTCSIELLTQDLDTYTMDAMESACRNPKTYSQDITISLCGNGGGITISKAFLTGLNYSGADAGTQENQRLTVTYTGFTSPVGINPVIILSNEDPCG